MGAQAALRRRLDVLEGSAVGSASAALAGAAAFGFLGTFGFLSGWDLGVFDFPLLPLSFLLLGFLGGLPPLVPFSFTSLISCLGKEAEHALGRDTLEHAVVVKHHLQLIYLCPFRLIGL